MMRIAAALLLAGLLCFPETAVNAAREAMYVWYTAVAPALFPFMALTPMITCPEAVRLYERLLGKLSVRLLGLPGAAAPAVVIAMVAGSPAGALAAAGCRLNRWQAERFAGCLCGPSPGFLVSGVGAAMLGSPAVGRLLARSHILAQLTLLTLTRLIPGGGESAEPAPAPVRSGSVAEAALGMLAVCGYMMLFGTAAAVAARLAGSERAGIALLALMDLPSGVRAVAGMNGIMEGKIAVLAGISGFGGACMLAQNLSALRPARPRAAVLALLRACCGLLCAGFASFGGSGRDFTIFNQAPELPFSALIAVFLLVPAWISLRNTSFLNKRIFAGNCRKTQKKPKNPQHVVDNVDN